MTNEFTIAVHALIFLNHEGAVFSSEDLTANVCISAARTREVVAKLKRADPVKTKGGMNGGYLLHRDNKDTSLSMVAEAPDTPFVTASQESGSLYMTCPISSGMTGIMNKLYREPNQCCQAYLEEVTITGLDSKIPAGTSKTITAT